MNAIDMIARCMQRSMGPPNHFMDLTEAQRAEVAGKGGAITPPAAEFSAPSDRGIEGYALIEATAAETVGYYEG